MIASMPRMRRLGWRLRLSSGELGVVLQRERDVAREERGGVGGYKAVYQYQELILVRRRWDDNNSSGLYCIAQHRI